MLGLTPATLRREQGKCAWQRTEKYKLAIFLRILHCSYVSSIRTSLKDKMLAQSKAAKVGDMNPYQNLEGGLANHLKPREDFCTKFFVGTEVSWNYLLLKFMFYFNFIEV